MQPINHPDRERLIKHWYSLDALDGFKAFRRSSLKRLTVTLGLSGCRAMLLDTQSETGISGVRYRTPETGLGRISARHPALAELIQQRIVAYRPVDEAAPEQPFPAGMALQIGLQHPSNYAKQVLSESEFQHAWIVSAPTRVTDVWLVWELFFHESLQASAGAAAKAQKALLISLLNHWAASLMLAAKLELEREIKTSQGECAGLLIDSKNRIHAAVNLNDRKADHELVGKLLQIPVDAASNTKEIRAENLAFRIESATGMRQVFIRPTTAADRMTAKQRQILALVAQGKRYKEIATILGLAVTTVANHVYRAEARLGVTSRLALLKLLEQRDSFSAQQSLAAVIKPDEDIFSGDD